MNSDKILNPKTGRYVLKTGKIGKELLLLKKNDINKCSDEKIKICEKINKICNTNSGRCIKIKKNEAKQSPKKESKTININKLKEEWKLIYNKNNSQFPSLNIINNTNNFLDVKISKTQKISIQSNCLFLRPTIFSYKDQYLDVHHA